MIAEAALDTTGHPPARTADDGRLRALFMAHRLHGYRRARLDPLELLAVPEVPELEPAFHGLAACDAELARLRAAYCGPLALDCAHLRDPIRQRWLWRRMERPRLLGPEQRRRVLQLVLAAEAWERLLNDRYSKHKRFSLEGCETLLPLLDALVRRAAARNVEEVVFGMAHRGRLNVLVNLLALPARRVLTLFSGAPDPALAGDLKYHLGHTARLVTDHGPVTLRLVHNPSHLESIDPVVCGMARALQDQRSDGGARVLPLLVHGDAAFCGQGVVMETLNLSQTRGYGCGGTVHVVLNNQVGFTTSDPADARSAAYCTDVARVIEAPVLHVNADHPDAAVLAAAIAADYRACFAADIVVDLVGFRRQGHNEQDAPELTQPEMQRRIAAHPGVVALQGRRLVSEGVLGAPELAALQVQAEARLTEDGECSALVEARASLPEQPPVSLPRLRTLAQAMARVPQGFVVHDKVRRVVDNWHHVGRDPEQPIDWPTAENLAYALVLAGGGAVRISGMDVGRGTFFHRHARWLDQGGSNRAHFPLRHLGPGQGRFDVFDSPLCEAGVLGFEYGYSVLAGPGLVVWEAQYGDFVNNAQVVLDQYLSTGEAKWGYSSGLVLLLPHGHEGVGPEHSNAYLGRFLHLCAGDNLRVAVPSTSAQLFHLLREQARSTSRRPLVVMTPKGDLLGLKASHAPCRALTGTFQPVIVDEGPPPEAIRRVAISAGKVHYDLVQGREGAGVGDLALLRLEQLYPFPALRLRQALARFPHLEEVLWVQEEVRNHGAWLPLRESLAAALPPGVGLGEVGRPSAAPSATSDPARHRREQEEIVARVVSGA